jgi:hypothetical protein
MEEGPTIVNLDDTRWLCELLRVTEPEIPVPKKRKRKRS